jgi:amino acid adenylation domain-containing protein
MDSAATPSSIQPTADQRSALLARLLADEGLDGRVARSIGRRTDADSAPLSYAQEVLWLLDRASPGLTAYNSPIARRIRGALDIGALGRAISAVVARHEALRTIFATRGDGSVQLPQPAAPDLLTLIDVRDAPAGERESRAVRALRQIADTPFDLTIAPPFHAALARIADDEAILLLLTHHIASDAWSYGIIFRELGALYDATVRGVPFGLPPVDLQFGDYAAWQREAVRGEAIEQQLAYWRERLAALPVLDLPTTRPATSAQGHAGARRAMLLPRATLDAVKGLAQQHGVTLYMVLLAAFQTVLHRYTGQDDIVVGSAVAGRTPPETEGIVGYFSQALPMRTRFDGDPRFAELLARVADTVLGTFEHQAVSLEALVLELQRVHGGDAPLFRVVLTMQDANLSELRLGDTAVTPVELDAGATKFDLTLLVTERPEGLDLSLWYRTELFEAATVDRFLGHIRRVLDAAVADPAQRISELPLLSAAEEAQLATWEAPFGTELASTGDGPLLPVAISLHAARSPAAVAVLEGEHLLTYAELADRAARLAHRLRALGVTTNTPVGLALERSADAIVAMLGIWQAGGAYVPLVPDLPAARLAQQATESGVRVVVTRAVHIDRLPPGLATIALDADAESLGEQPNTPVPLAAGPDDLAYILFTSGSTGVPKGVAVTHANLAHYTFAIVARLGFADGGWSDWPLNFATVSTLGADLGHTAVFPALATGGVLHVLSPEVTTGAAQFADYFATHAVDLLKITPSHLQALIAGRSGAALAAVLPRRWLVLGGEPLPWSLADTLLAVNRCRVLNHYGPTETTVGATTFELSAQTRAHARDSGAQTVPIGRALPGVRLHVLDAHGARAPVGVPGELCVGGAGVAQGYFNQPERTTERFVADAFGGADARMYRTGDRVRWLECGMLEFLGRGDDQVKVRGYRVELGDIEQALGAHHNVARAAVLLRPAGDDSAPVLAAYVVPKAASGYAGAHAERLTAAAVTRFLAERLPDYMVPSAVVLLDALPLTANGKLDRAALPPLDPGTKPEPSYVAPRTSTETRLAAIWAEVFKRDQIGVTDQFLQLGGHSLLAIRILGKLTRTFGVRLPLRALFDAPTVEQLARMVDEASAAATTAPAGA